MGAIESDAGVAGPVPEQPLSARQRRRFERRAASGRGSARRLLRAQLALLLDDGHELDEAAALLHVDVGGARELLRSVDPRDARAASVWHRRLDGIDDVRRAAPRATRTVSTAAATRIRRGVVHGARTARSRTARDVAILVAVAAATIIPIAGTLLAGRTVVGNNDVGWLIQEGATFDLWPFTPPTPHFLFPLLVRIAYLLTAEVSLGLAVTAVLVLIRALTAVGVYAVLRDLLDDGGPRAGRLAAVLGAAALLVVESPRILVSGRTVGPGDAFLPLQTLFSATGMAVVPFAVIGVALFVSYVRRARHGPVSVRRQAVTAAVLLLAGLAKPSFTAAFLPVLPLWALWYGRGGAVPVRKVMWSVSSRLLVPLVALTAWQLWWMAQPERSFAHGGSSTIVWSPLTLARTWGAERPALWLALPVPPIGIIVGGRRWLRRPKVVLLVVAAALSVTEFLLLTESGERANDGSLGWGAQIAFYLLAVEAVRAFASALPERRPVSRTRTIRLGLAGALLATATVSGLVVLVADGWMTSPCLRGTVTVTHYDADVPGGTYRAVECA